jgi:hypothetical protein
VAGPFTDQALWARVIRHARCADGTHDPEQWFPVSVQIQKPRHEAAAAIAVCAICPVRARCLVLSLRHWDIGQHGIWGGLVAAERAAVRRLLRAHMARRARASSSHRALIQVRPHTPPQAADRRAGRAST